MVLDFQSRTPYFLYDHGVGAANNGVATTGFGLLGLRERVHLLAGRLTIESAPNQGFALEVAVPG